MVLRRGRCADDICAAPGFARELLINFAFVPSLSKHESKASGVTLRLSGLMDWVVASYERKYRKIKMAKSLYRNEKAGAWAGFLVTWDWNLSASWS